MQNHVYPRTILLGPSPVSIVGALLEERLGDLVVDVLLLEVVLVLERNVAVEVLQPGSLTEAKELVVNETVLHAVQLVDILYDGQALILHKTLDKSVSAEGNTKTLISLCSEAPEGEHGAEVRKSRGVCNDIVGCLMHGVGREALDEDLCLENIDVEASVIPKNLLKVRENLERDTEFRLDVAVIGVCDCTCILLVLRERPAPQVVDAQAENNHFERVSLLTAGLALRVEHLAEVVEVSQVRLGGAHRFEVFEHVSKLVANSLKIVTLFKPAGIIARGCASEDIQAQRAAEHIKSINDVYLDKDVRVGRVRV